MKSVISFFLSFLMFLFPTMNIPKLSAEKETWKNTYTDIFVSGFIGWGEGSPLNSVMPYWGLLGGDAVVYLRARGFDVHAARMHPTASNWDRACELYAHITGTVTDYGAEHSARCGHARYGRDYSGKALAPAWNEQDKINLIGYSLGGTTVLQFLDLLENGSEAEQNATPVSELSGLFKGGKATQVHSVMMLASPMNGVTAFGVLEEINGDKKATVVERAIATGCNMVCKPIADGRIETDCAIYDMTVDASAERNREMHLPDNVYYFSMPFSTTTQNKDGTWTAIPSTEPAFKISANRIGKYKTTTEGGIVIDGQWLENDGLVNTISATAPFGAKTKALDKDSIEPGIWNLYPTQQGDHMMMMGDLLFPTNVRPFYVNLLNGLHCAV